jgi:hypothetical protein
MRHFDEATSGTDFFGLVTLAGDTSTDLVNLDTAEL